MAGPKRLCPSCNEHVPTTIVDTQSGRELKCGFCGLTLDQGAAGTAFTGPKPSADYSQRVASGADQLNQTNTQALPPLIHIAEDSRLIRKIVVGHFQQRFKKSEVIASENGRHAVENLTRALTRGRRQGIAIFDLQMPKLNGIAAAIAYRGIEKAFDNPPIPIIFFSAVRTNDKLQEAMTQATPAAYLHKSDTENPENMLGRLEEVMSITVKRVYG